MKIDKKTIVIDSVESFMFGTSPYPVQCGRGVEIGNGTVIPEINFTLPPMEINESTWKDIRDQYSSMIQSVMKRAAELEVPSLLVEFETLPPMTQNFGWAREIIRILTDVLDNYHERYGIRSALRVTPNDTREFVRPPAMRRGVHWDEMVYFFENAGAAGADLLAIESTGGKEVCDEALMNADLAMVVFSLGVLGSRDMEFLWRQIVESCKRTDVIPSGDSACAFGNTAMTLADQRMIPKVFAAVVRAATVPRSLVAVEMGAVGPSKDCAYEGPYLKAIHGIPISMEGRTSACAHLSPLGNIAQAVCDCWSNESVANVRLLSTFAPVVSMEQLAYDCRLMNTALMDSPQHAILLREWLTKSDAFVDPQAYVLQPDVVIRISKRIMTQTDNYNRTVEAVRASLDELRDGKESGRLQLTAQESRWLERLHTASDALPDNETDMVEDVLRDSPAIKFIPEEYGLTV
jgi:methanol---5-hydroxybenzimidazolylcobamide Co-methyltransferase